MKPFLGSDLFGSDPKEVIQEALGTSDFHGHFAPLDLTTIQFLLSTPSGIIVSRQTETLGSFPSVTKEV